MDQNYLRQKIKSQMHGRKKSKGIANADKKNSGHFFLSGQKGLFHQVEFYPVAKTDTMISFVNITSPYSLKLNGAAPLVAGPPQPL